MRTVMLGLLLSASLCALPVFAVENAGSSEWSWKCQYPGKWAFCSLVCDQGCIEGPNGFPGMWSFALVVSAGCMQSRRHHCTFAHCRRLWFL